MAAYEVLNPREDFEGAKLVGVSSTFYKTWDVRAKLAAKNAERYAANDLPLVVVDASPDPEFAEAFADRGATVIKAPRPGLATQYIDGVSHIVERGGNKVVRHEPEKITMSDFAEPIAESLDETDILVIGRTPEAMRSLPRRMAESEETCGLILQTQLGLPKDPLSGGRGYSKAGAEVLLGFDVNKHGNNWTHLYEPVVRARRERPDIKVGSLLIDLRYPYEMLEDEEGSIFYANKRAEQLLLQAQWALKTVGCEIEFPMQPIGIDESLHYS